MKWPFATRKRRELEQEAEYQAFVDAHRNKSSRLRSQQERGRGLRAHISPNAKISPELRTALGNLGRSRTVSYGPAEPYNCVSLGGYSGISCTYADSVLARYHPEAVDE